MTEIQPNDIAEEKGALIPHEQAEQIRRLSHDLSNALEIILQTNYLVGMAEAGQDSEKWRSMLDQGVRQAAQINSQLREYIRAHS